MRLWDTNSCKAIRCVRDFPSEAPVVLLDTIELKHPGYEHLFLKIPGTSSIRFFR